MRAEYRPRKGTLNRASGHLNIALLWIKVVKRCLQEVHFQESCGISWSSADNLFPLQLHFLGIFSYIRKTLNKIFECFPFMFFCDCSVSNKGNPGTLSHMKFVTC